MYSVKIKMSKAKVSNLLVLLTLQIYIVLVKCEPCSRVESLYISDGVLFDNNSIVFNGVEYVDGNWFEVEEANTTVRLGCPCIGRQCVWKCCGDGELHVGRNCERSDLAVVNPFNPPLYRGNQLVDTQASQQFFYMHNRLCEERYLVDSSAESEEIYLQENGTLYEFAIGVRVWHSPRQYCVDMMMDDNSSLPSRMIAAVCYPDSQPDVDSPVLYIAYAVGLLCLSVPFLLATFLVYAFIPELRNLHGLCLMSYVAGLLVAYSFLAYLKLHKTGVTMTGCFVVAFIVYYAFQTSFFWLNVMCFDIWRTFSGYRGGSTNKKREQRRFALYGVYAWGGPAVLTAITMAMQFNTNLPTNIITPGIGDRKCWFADRASELLYFYTPAFVLVVSNVILFSITAYRIRSIRQETAILKGAESARSDTITRDKHRYALYFKLFVVMGVNWSLELIGSVVGGSNWYWIVIDLSNISLGFFIFFIFVWKNKVRNLIMKRYRSARGVLTPHESGTGRWNTRSSSAPTEDTRISSDDSAVRLRDVKETH